MKKKIRVISLFSGCGGFDLGFKKAGFDIVFANDNEKNLKDTYEKNLGHTLIVDDIKKIDKKLIPSGDVIIAGIPWQSKINKRQRW